MKGASRPVGEGLNDTVA